MQEFGNPLAGCLPLLLQMPILFALFATLRGSPFSDINYTVDVQIFPQEQIERILPQAFSTKSQNVFISDGVHSQISALLPTGNKLTVGETEKIELQTIEGKSLQEVISQYPDNHLEPRWLITKGEERISINGNGEITALAVGDATIQVTIPGIAADKGFLFIKALGRVGATNPDGSINWDIVGMIIFFGLSIYLNQELSGSGPKPSGNDQQQSINKITPIIFSGMFLFFPLPAGVLMYIVLANIFQTIQTLILTREPLPENIQKIVDEQEKAARGREEIPFEKKSLKKKEKTS